MTLEKQLADFDQTRAEWADWVQANQSYVTETVAKLKRAMLPGGQESFTPEEAQLLRNGFLFAMNLLALDVKLKESMG